MIQNPVLKNLFCRPRRKFPVRQDLNRFWEIALKGAMVCGFRMKNCLQIAVR
ncbi:hypothetical protein CKA32_006020 [Geitlerinema sp. FC II]|nr:hypothetical protein CKA32_006020 [Geitlerinema sp. FC II]